MQNLHHSTWNFEILYADGDGQLLVRPLSRETKITNMAGGWKVKYTFYFIERSHEPLYVDQLSFVQSKIMDIPTSFTLIIIFFDVAF
jgi:hypothetical protein